MPALDEMESGKRKLVSDRTVTRGLTAGYLLGLALIAGFSIGVHLLLDHVISQQHDAATIINVAGRQRMLSQRIGMLAADLKLGDTDARQPLLDAMALMQRSQDALVQGGDLGIRNALSPTARQFYFEGLEPLDPEVRRFLDVARRFAAPAEGDDVEDAFRRLEIMSRTGLLPALNQAVLLFEREANARVEQLRDAQSIVLVIILVALSLEAMFIFRPLVSRVSRYAAQLYEMATRDGLTGLSNRRDFMDRASHDLLLARQSGKPLSAIVLDLDHFKKINDHYGHAVGDAVLRRFAEISTTALRPRNAMSRIGGEEFALVLPDTALPDAMAVAERLRNVVANDRSASLPVFTLSVGVSALEAGDKSIDDVLSRADRALYKAKKDGRNRVATLLHDDPLFAAPA